jgi:hypothetical protein
VRNPFRLIREHIQDIKFQKDQAGFVAEMRGRFETIVKEERNGLYN